MGAKSTVELTRAEVISRITRAIQTATNEELTDALECLVGDRKLENYRVFDEDFGVKE